MNKPERCRCQSQAALAPQEKPSATRCTAITAEGRPCRAWAMKGTEPPRCAAHRDRRVVKRACRHGPGDPPSLLPPARASAPPAEGEARSRQRSPDTREATTDLPPKQERRGPTGLNRETITLDEQIAGLSRRIEHFGHLLDSLDVQESETITVADYAKLLALYGQLCSRLGRLMKDREQLTTGESDEIQQAIHDALDIVAEDLGVEL
jgi:hypothetical protein